MQLSSCDGTRKPKRVYMHRLIYEAFHGPIPPGMTVNHKNNVKYDNRPENLELATHQEQATHCRAFPSRRWRKGDGWTTAKLTEQDVCDIRERYAGGGCTQKQLAAEYGVVHGTIGHILKRRNWTHI